MPIKNFIRTGEFFRIISSLETGADHGMWTFQRYSTWLENKKVWHFATAGEAPDSESVEAQAVPPLLVQQSGASKSVESKPAPAVTPSTTKPAGRIEIEPLEGGLGEVLKKLE
jgi:hypothetical protein